LATDDFDFVFAVGDDDTDEDLFRAMPASAVTIRIGTAGTHARFNLRNSAEVVSLLESFVKGRGLPSTIE
jgi:trehalose 6-phosphate synthase/phosphatase